MIIFLTIVFIILFIWSLYSFELVGEYGLKISNYKYDGLLATIAKLYWLSIIIFIISSILFITFFAVSYTIVCNATNGDYPTCEKVNK